MTLPLLDPSGRKRHEPLCNPVLSHALPPSGPDGRRLFIHFQDIGHPNLLQGLVAAGPPATVYIRDLPGNARRRLTDAGFDVLGKPADLGKLLPACCGVVHYGGLGLSSLALACGIPQVMVSTDLEKYFTATRIRTGWSWLSHRHGEYDSRAYPPGNTLYSRTQWYQTPNPYMGPTKPVVI